MLFDDAVLVGKVKKCSSSKGDVMIFFTDPIVKEGRSKFLILEINGLKTPFFIESCEAKGSDTLYVNFKEVLSENDSLQIIGANVYYPIECVADAENIESPSLNYFIGFKVYDKSEGFLGMVEGVDDSSINMLLYVKGEKEIIIPFCEDFLINFDPCKRMLRLNLPEGLTNIN